MHHVAEFFVIFNNLSAVAACAEHVVKAIKVARDLDGSERSELRDHFRKHATDLRTLCMQLRKLEQRKATREDESHFQESQQSSSISLEKAQLEKLQSRVNAIDGILRGRNLIQGQDAEIWKGFVLSGDLVLARKQNDVLLRCIRFIFRKNELYREVLGLTEVIESLENSSHVHDLARRKVNDINTANQAIEQRGRKNCNTIMDCYNKRLDRDSIPLVFAPPDNFNLTSSILKRRVQIDFISVRSGPNHESSSHSSHMTVMACHFERPKRLRTGLNLRARKQYHVDLSENMRSTFMKLIQESADVQEEQREQLYKFRMTSALYITVLAVTLLSTELMRDLSTKRIKRMEVHDQGEQVPLLVSGHSTPLQHMSDAMDDRPSAFYFLAVLLAELGLAQPVDPEGPAHFKVQTSSTGSVDLERPQLLQRVQEATSITYEKAVAYCFDADSRISIAATSQKSQERLLDSTESILDFIRYVFYPVASQYRIAMGDKRDPALPDRHHILKVHKAMRLPVPGTPSRASTFSSIASSTPSNS